VEHDAGGANPRDAWISDIAPEVRPEIVATGPAAMILRSLVNQLLDRSQLDRAVLRHSTVISGTGWMSDLEHEARLLAARFGRRSIALLDHWTDYAGRFVRGGVSSIPDEIWVVDDVAKAMAESEFPSVAVTIQPNRYLDKMIRAVGAPDSSSTRALFLSEPIRKPWRSDGCEVVDIASMIAVASLRLQLPPVAQFAIRPHPSQHSDDCLALAEVLGARLLDQDTDDLTTSLRSAAWVFGLESYGLLVAAESGRQAISCLPPAAQRCRIPSNKVIFARDFVE